MSRAPRQHRAGALRRYPGLILLVAAAALAILLPSALNVPQSGPSTLAEFAPVPGSGEGRSDISDLGQAGSGGLGFGAGSGGSAQQPAAQAGAPKQGKARLKRCVGNPPRQTEDLLSPPCVAFFEGDNGGATSKGVTGDEVTVVDANSTVTPQDPRLGQIIDCALPVTSDDDLNDQNCKADMRYFNDRYQTYNRVVHLWKSHVQNNLQEINERRNPFAVAPGGPPSAKVMSVSYTGTLRSAAQKNAPYSVSFRPDLDDQARMAASYICLKLVGRRARYSPDLMYQTRTRKFGFIFEDGGDAGKKRLDDELKAQCNYTVPSSAIYASNPTAVASLKNDDVTTVIVLLNMTNPATTTTFATGLGYFPEWVIPGYNGQVSADTNNNGRTYNSTQWQNAFGITFEYRRDARLDQAWYRAYRDGCPECTEPGAANAPFLASTYDMMSMLFYGIQAAGPRLTPQNWDKGMHAIPPNGSPNPYKPAAYFAPGNYSYLKDAMEIWWDPSGLPPGETTAGCYRLPFEGRRFRTGEWTAGDDSVHQAGSPCQGSTVQT